MIVVRPQDPLDLAEARRLVDALEALPPGVRVLVDVSRVRDVHPTALAALAYALDRDGRVRLGGLRRHHERLLSYLLATPPPPTGESLRVPDGDAAAVADGAAPGTAGA